jgi:hypothetical protein
MSARRLYAKEDQGRSPQNDEDIREVECRPPSKIQHVDDAAVRNSIGEI